MEEKFDAEFKRKVKGINPEIPEVVRMRISDTLASLPKKRILWKPGYISAVAALFFVCFLGIRYIFPMQLAKDSASETAQNPTIAAADKLRNGNEQEKTSYTVDASIAKDKTAEKVSGNSTNTMQKSATAPDAASSSGASEGTAYGDASDTANDELTLTEGDGRTAADQGIQLILKTAIYDGKEIRIEFDKCSTRSKAFAASGVLRSATTSNTKSSSTLQNAQVNVVENYDIRVVVDNIPLKCSINVLETPQGENQYSGTMIIVPESGLPEKFDMILNFDKIGEISGQWLLTTQVLKQ